MPPSCVTEERRATPKDQVTPVDEATESAQPKYTLEYFSRTAAPAVTLAMLEDEDTSELSQKEMRRYGKLLKPLKALPKREEFYEKLAASGIDSVPSTAPCKVDAPLTAEQRSHIQSMEENDKGFIRETGIMWSSERLPWAERYESIINGYLGHHLTFNQIPPCYLEGSETQNPDYAWIMLQIRLYASGDLKGDRKEMWDVARGKYDVLTEARSVMVSYLTPFDDEKWTEQYGKMVSHFTANPDKMPPRMLQRKKRNPLYNWINAQMTTFNDGLFPDGSFRSIEWLEARRKFAPLIKEAVVRRKSRKRPHE